MDGHIYSIYPSIMNHSKLSLSISLSGGRENVTVCAFLISDHQCPFYVISGLPTRCLNTANPFVITNV